MSPVDPINQILVALIIAIVGHAITIVVKSPKEAIKELTKEVSDLKVAQARHDQSNLSLKESLNALAQRLDRLEPYVNKTHERRRGA